MKGVVYVVEQSMVTFLDLGTQTSFLKEPWWFQVFRKNFMKVEMGSLWLSNGDRCHGKACSDLETVASSLVLLAVMLRQN